MTYLRRTPEPVGQSARYLDKLAEYDFELQHRPGVQHQNALSSHLCERGPETPPCNQCRAMSAHSAHDVPADHVRTLHASPTSDEPPAKRRRHTNKKSVPVDDDELVDPQGKSLLSKEMLREHQEKDPIIGLVIRWLTTPDMAPTTSELTSSEPEVQGLYAQRESLRLIDGVLYHNYERSDATLQFQKVGFLQSSHTGLINGHFGVEKSRERLRQLAYWQGWTEDLRLFVARCQLCNQHRHGPTGRQGLMQPAIACTPMQKVHIDLMGPHVTSSNGYKYILTVICAFTKYLIAVPILDKTKKTVARALMKNVYLVHGPPEILVHDQGREFWSQVMHWQICWRFKSPKSVPQLNGVIELVHATMHAAFVKIVNSTQRNWCQPGPD